MFRFACFITLLAVSLTWGCAACCGPYDDDYNVFGGRFQRSDTANGRVGSALSDPYFSGYGPQADSNLAPETPIRVPEPIDEDQDGTLRDLDEEERDFERELEELRREIEQGSPKPSTENDAETARKNRSRNSRSRWR